MFFYDKILETSLFTQHNFRGPHESSLMLQPATAFIYCHSSGANTLRVGGLCWIYAVKFSYSWRSGRF